MRWRCGAIPVLSRGGAVAVRWQTDVWYALGENKGKHTTAPRSLLAFHAGGRSKDATARPDKQVGRSRYAYPAGHRSHERGSGCGAARGFRWHRPAADGR